MTFATRFASVIAVGAGFWMLSHAYQSWRYTALAREDERMLSVGVDEPERARWLEAVERESLNFGVRQSTLLSLAESGYLGERALEVADSGLYARRHDPPLASEVYLVFPYLLAAWVGSLSSMPLAIFLASSVSLGQEDARFRIAPVPFLLIFIASGAASCSGGTVVWTILCLPIAFLFAVVSFVLKRVGGVTWHAGDYLTLSIALTAVLVSGSVIEFLGIHLVCAIVLAFAIKYRPGFKRMKDNIPYNAVLSTSLVGASLLKVLEGVLL